MIIIWHSGWSMIFSCVGIRHQCLSSFSISRHAIIITPSRAQHQHEHLHIQTQWTQAVIRWVWDPNRGINLGCLRSTSLDQQHSRTSSSPTTTKWWLGKLKAKPWRRGIGCEEPDFLAYISTLSREWDIWCNMLEASSSWPWRLYLDWSWTWICVCVWVALIKWAT